jgi:1-hydroxy-2-methyl-2-(E)-butenyl 4-diphosphate synthase
MQSMLTCDTMDTAECVRQTLDLVAVGCQLVRITAPTVKDAANLEHIVHQLRTGGCHVPIVADIHFKPEAALEAAKWVEKVRINPGNYADSKKFAVKEYTDDAYAAELKRIEDKFTPLVLLCQKLGRALRIGTNHGSLSDRIMNRYGDTPLGMVESALEFARIARAHGFHNFLFSMKSSNPKVMIECYRLLVARLEQEGPDWNYPIHLGVTEAGDGEDGRIKSAIGIGSLLCDGLGDTIRVSLTEDSPREIEVCRDLLAQIPVLAVESLNRSTVEPASAPAATTLQRFNDSTIQPCSQSPQMKPPVHIDHLARAERQRILRNGRHGPAHVLRRAPAGDGREAVGDQLVVFLLHRPGHVRGDDAGADFIDVNAVLGQARGEQWREHGERGLRDAILPAVNRGGIGADGRDGDDLGFGEGSRDACSALFDHPSRGELRQEVWALDIDIHEPVEAFLSGFENIGAFDGRHAGVVDEHVQPAKFLPREIDELLSIRARRDVRLANLGAEDAAGCLGQRQAILRRPLRRRLVAGEVDHQIAADLRQFQRDAAANAARRAGDQCREIHQAANNRLADTKGKRVIPWLL